MLVTLLSLIITYGLSFVIGGKKNVKHFFFFIGILINVCILFIYKYLGFFGDIFHLELSLDLVMPIGISFYTFQAISYLSDVYQGKSSAQKNFILYMNYMLMFPQVVAGPIVRYEAVEQQLVSRTIKKDDFFEGVKLFAFGLSMKAILADTLGMLWFRIGAIGYESISTPLAWLGIIGYSVQLYLDFAGYSLMAIGLGKCIGFSIPQNFDYPYMSLSMTEFWRRWHMTLGSWFRDYVYIPLGGNRKGAVRTYFNLLLVWLLTGLWHGASWNFVIWGLFLFIVISNEKLWLKRILEKYHVVGHLYMMILIPLSWMVFAISDYKELIVYGKRLIGLGGEAAMQNDIVKYVSQYGIFLCVGLICCTPLLRKLYEKIPVRLVRVIILIILCAGSVYRIYQGMNNPFMYFSF